MRAIRLILLSIVLFFSSVIIAGAQTPTTVTLNTQNIEPDVSPDGLLQWNIVYYPKSQSNNKDLDAVKQDIIKILKDVEINDRKNNFIGNPYDIKVVDDRIEGKISRKQSFVIDFADSFLESTLGVKEAVAVYPSLSRNVSGGSITLYATVDGQKMSTTYKPYKIQFNASMNFSFERGEISNAKKLADDLFFIQHQTNESKYKSQLNIFEPMAAKYRALKVKPPISEDQRRYIVQANSFNKQKQYSKAINMFYKVIEVDQTAYPAAYLNVALLSAIMQRYDAAIFYMKKYLLLEPDAPDARSAQDKIYEWEISAAK